MKNYCVEGFEEIFDKIIKGEELTWEEVRDIYWELPSIEEEEGEHFRWCYPVIKIFQVYDKYYSILIMKGLTELQDNDYEAQVAIEVKLKAEIVMRWVPV
jgi:hypothetical protein